MKKFETGETYTARDGGGYRWTFEVLGRTKCFVTIRETNARPEETKRVRVKTDDEGEWALPLGSYSLAPVMRA